MDLINCNKITQKEVEYINKKKSKGLSLPQIISDTMSSDASKEEIKSKAKSFSKRLNRAGYKLVNEVYVLQKTEDVKGESSKLNTNIEDKNDANPNKNMESKIEIPKKKYVTKKQKETELQEQQNKKNEELKLNPYGLSSGRVSVIVSADDVHCSIIKESKGVGVYLLPAVTEKMKIVTDRFSYIPNYFFANISVWKTSIYVDYFNKSIWIDEFSKLIIAEKMSKNKDSKKQVNFKFSTEILNNYLPNLEEQFPFLSKSEIVNMCIYAYCSCVINNPDFQEIQEI